MVMRAVAMPTAPADMARLMLTAHAMMATVMLRAAGILSTLSAAPDDGRACEQRSHRQAHEYPDTFH